MANTSDRKESQETDLFDGKCDHSFSTIFEGHLHALYLTAASIVVKRDETRFVTRFNLGEVEGGLYLQLHLLFVLELMEGYSIEISTGSGA